MNHPDWPAMVSAIVAEPDDDTLRLVAADFLEEHGDAERAAFIRAQVKLAQVEMSGLGLSLEADELRKQERAFLGPFSVCPHFWAVNDCPELVNGILPPGRSARASLHVEGVERLGWRRGFIEAIRCPVAEWLRHGVAVRTRNPVRCVALTNCGAVVRYDDWYANIAALRGLALIEIVDGPAPQAHWLSIFLPGTQVVRHEG